MVPSLSSISSKIPSNSNSMILFPSSTISLIVPISKPSPNSITAPTLHFFPGFTRHSQAVFDFLLSSNISIAAPVSFFTPISLAGITLVSLSTRQSPSSR